MLGGIALSPVLILLSTRPQFQPSWPASPHAGELRLEPLADAEIRGIVKQLETAEGFLTEQEMTRVAERAGGVPLFAIELTRLIWEQHTSPGDRQIPASLSDLLMARLDQLGAAKGVAQLASVIGNEFPLTVLEAVSDVKAASLYSRLSVLKKHGSCSSKRERRSARTPLPMPCFGMLRMNPFRKARVATFIDASPQ